LFQTRPILSALLCISLAAGEAERGFAARCERARAGAGTVRILHFGDSHLAGSGSQDYAAFFQGQFGHGGPGLGLPWVCGQPGMAARASRGWRKVRNGLGDPLLGLNAGFLETWRAGETASATASFSKLRVQFLTDDLGGRASVKVDGQILGEIDLAGPKGQLAVFARDLPPKTGRRTLEIRTVRDGAVRILGVALEEAAGAVYSPLAFNGARAAWMNAIPEPLFRAEVAAANPDLVILSFGTNEANDADFRPDLYRKDLEELLARFKAAAPRALLLLAGPPDAQLKKGTPRTLESVIEVQRSSAAAFGALFVNRRQAMGGPGAMETWLGRGWANPDRVHFTAPGYQALAQALLRSLAEATGLQAILAGWNPASRASALPREKAVAPAEETHAPIHLYRRKDGSLLWTNDPTKVASPPGEWAMLD
jgi:lysophospholipase L1-like esterase